MSEHELRPDTAASAETSDSTPSELPTATEHAAPQPIEEQASVPAATPSQQPAPEATVATPDAAHVVSGTPDPQPVSAAGSTGATSQTAPSVAEPPPTAQVPSAHPSHAEPQPFEKIELPPAEEKPAPVVVTDELLTRLQGIMERGEVITVHVAQRIRGGLRVLYDGIKMFLPASQFFLKKTPSNEELQAAVGSDIPVQIADIVKDEAGRISFVVSRRNLLREEFYRRIKVGDIVEGVITSIQSFGLFVDIGGFDGLVHISRVSHRPPANLADAFKVGETVRAQIVEIDPSHDKISLSMKALEPSPWQTALERYRVGERYSGVVTRLAPFGAFVELEPGVEGLIRNGELSWTRRVRHPSEILREGENVEVVVLEIKPERGQIDLSLRRTTDNPWPAIAAKYPRGMHTTGVVREVSGPGVLLTIAGEVDAFMPRSQMRAVLKGKRIPYSVGDIVAVTVVDVSVETESFIVAPRVEPEEELFGPPREGAHPSKQEPARTGNPRKITLGELLSEEERQRLYGGSE
ncbi:30S ribosomal protein S1 [bacterium HR20]|nr:30S ribosomal protein S1 [bacterium HR20]